MRDKSDAPKRRKRKRLRQQPEGNSCLQELRKDFFFLNSFLLPKFT